MLLESRFTIVMLLHLLYFVSRRHSTPKMQGIDFLPPCPASFPNKENTAKTIRPGATHLRSTGYFRGQKSMKLIISQRSIHLFGDPARKQPLGEPYLFSPNCGYFRAVMKKCQVHPH
jgi:hypothetical protein